MKVGFIGLGSVGAKLAGSLLRNGIELTVHDLDTAAVKAFVDRGASSGKGAAEVMRRSDVVITSLPSPAACDAVLMDVLPEMRPGKTWVEMSTTDPDEMIRHGELVSETGAHVAECPVSGGCHRADTGNISIFAGGERAAIEHVMPILRVMGRRILHTGPLGSASKLKVMTNYLATVNLLSLCEALTTMKAAGLDLGTTYEAIRISSGNSFVHETESQLILSGSRDVNFTMDLVQKDIGLFQKLAETLRIPLEISPLIIDIMTDGQRRCGERAQSNRIIERLEEATELEILYPGFPHVLVDEEPEALGSEVARQRDADAPEDR
ncbi:NAD(P)-dependent oxidoreductase [Halovulum sp. GXIMD14794]